MTNLSRTIVVLAALLVASAPARACNIPVFRYALDHWAADPYRLTLFHRGPLDDASRTIVKTLEADVDLDFPTVLLHRIDQDKDPEVAKGVPTPPAGQNGPWLVVQYPSISRIETPLWSGPLSTFVVRDLLESPARRELARRIRGGDSAVFVMLASGDRARDDAVELLLRAELTRLQKELKIPKRTGAPEDQLVDEAGRPLRLAFSMLRVERSDPTEAWLVKMLLNTEDDLPGRTEPMVFPVFGRGRALPALVGDGITPGNISESAAFLVGPCSCEVKRENPGVDLLITANWGVAPGLSAEAATTPVTATVSTVVAPPAPAMSAVDAVETPVPPSSSRFTALAIAAVVILMTGAWLVLRGTRPSGKP